MKPVHSIVIAAFVAGFGVAWWVKPLPAAAKTETAPLQRTRAERIERSASGRPSSVRAAITPAQSDFLKRLKESAHDEKKQRELIASLEASEIPALLAEMASRAGMQGLDYSDKAQLNELVKGWYMKTPEAALAWVLALENSQDRGVLIEQIIEQAADADLDAAVELTLRHSHDEKGGIRMPSFLLEKAVKLGEDKLLEICRKGISKDGSTNGIGLTTYPAGFDFKRVLDELAKTKASLGQHEDFDTVPTTLLSEWATRDSQAAWEWLQLGTKVTYNCDVDDFFEGYSKIAGPAEVGSFVGSLFDPAASNGSDAYRTTWDVLADKPSLESIEGFLQAAKGDRATHLQGLFEASLSGSGGCYDDFRNLVLQLMDPPTRVEALKRSFGERGGATDNQLKAITPALRGLGHGDEEIESLLPLRKSDP